MCKAQFLAAFPGRCPGPLAASSHRAKSIHGSRRSGRIMRSLPELPIRQRLWHQKSPCCNQRRSFVFIFRELTGKMKWTKFYAKDWSDEVLPFGFFFFFIHPKKHIFPCGSSFINDKAPELELWRGGREHAKPLLAFLHFRVLSRLLFSLPSRSEEFANVLNKMSGYIQPLCKYSQLMMGGGFTMEFSEVNPQVGQGH